MKAEVSKRIYCDLEKEPIFNEAGNNGKVHKVKSIQENKTTQPLIYISHRDKVGGGKMGQEEININLNAEGLEPVILDLILDTLSYGIARSIVNSAVELISPTEVTQDVNKNLVDE